MHCPICNSKQFVLIQKGVWDSAEKNIFKCQKCAIVFLHPLMNNKEIENFYKNYQKHVKNRLPNKKALADVDKQQIIQTKRQLRIIKPHLDKKDKLCDIGASKGYFLKFVKPYVSEVTAIEPGTDEGKILKKNNIKTYNWISEIPKSVSFDFVSLFHTFEHLPQPLEYLDKLRGKINRHGRIAVEVPNIDDALISRYNISSFKKFYFQSMHCFYYNPTTLSMVFEKRGFKLIGCNFVQRYTFSNHLQWLLKGTPGGNAVFNKQFKIIDKKYQDILEKEEITDTILCVFQKI